MKNKDKSELPIIKHTSEDKLFNYLCEIGATPIDTEIHEIRLIVYEELGLSGIENHKEWVENMKIHKDITGFQTPAELTAYEKGRNDEEKVMVKFIGDWQPNETNSVIGQLLADKNNKLQAELKQAKADAWDEGRDSTFRSDTPNPENPYKGE